MGIKGIRNFLKNQYNPEHFEELVPFDVLRGKKIAVDTSIFVCMYKIVYPNTFEEEFMNLFVALLEHGIEPIFVFDGKSPEEKSEEKKKREEKKHMQCVRIESLERDLECYHKTQKVSQLLWDVNNKLVKKGHEFLKDNFSLAHVTLYVEKLKSQVLTLTSYDFELVKQLCSIFGVHYIIAEGEAEILCSQLVKSNIAYAVLTKDTDVLACGCPVMLSDIKLKSRVFSIIYLDNILKKLDLDYSKWLDFCIMCGTDFNDNIPKIGPVKSYKYIKAYGNLEQISKYINTSILKYENVRNIFNALETKSYADDAFSKLKLDMQAIQKRILDHKLKISYDNLRDRLAIVA
jgi:5'-3' exonuclease